MKSTSLALLIATLWIVSKASKVSTRKSSRLKDTSDCPCQDPQWCQPLDTPAVRSRELYGFARNTLEMNWTHVTTVAWAEDNLTCRAHARGVKSVFPAPNINLADLSTVEARRQWASNALDEVIHRYRDGIVFDYEGPVTDHPLWGYTYAELISETYRLFKKSNPNYQVSVCVPWSPDNIDGRNYPWTRMQADLFYVMDYDTRSQIYDACIAGANAPLPGMIRGLERWKDAGIPFHKIVLGVPWYGYIYTCLNGTHVEDKFCPIRQVPFRGVNCSDAAGSEIAYDVLIRLMDDNGATVRRDDNTGAPFFNVLRNDTVHQVWFDDPLLLRRKYQWARDHGLLGVGPFMYDDLDSAEPETREAMWNALDVFFGTESKPTQIFSTMVA